jgi:DNA-binding GntR family transcriptional regulator
MAQNHLNLGTLLPAPSLKDMAHSTIKEAILSKKLKPGELYTETNLKNELGISKTPVREALILLASRGLILYSPRRGFTIKEMTEKDVSDLFELRLSLELTVIRHIIPNFTEESLTQTERIWKQYLRAGQTGNPVRLINANRDFHLHLAQLTENSYLIRAREEIQDLTELASAQTLEFDSRTLEAIGEHERIFVELKRRSLKGALRQMEIHIQTTEERVMAGFEKPKLK